jgi:hypothetical protein
VADPGENWACDECYKDQSVHYSISCLNLFVSPLNKEEKRNRKCKSKNLINSKPELHAVFLLGRHPKGKFFVFNWSKCLLIPQSHAGTTVVCTDPLDIQALTLIISNIYWLHDGFQLGLNY